jgi:hypothetical protein
MTSSSFRIALAWLAVDLALIAASIVTFAMSPGAVEQLKPTFLQNMFLLDYEANVPNWFSSIQLAFVAFVWLTIAGSARSGGKPDRRMGVAALLVSGAALFGSLDEIAQVHEKIGIYTMDSLFPRTGYWLFIYLPVLLLLAIAVTALVGRQLWDQRRAVAWIVAGGALYLFAAGGLELMLNFIAWGGTAELIELHFEEAGELLGVWLILWGSLQLRDAFSASVPAIGPRQ